MMHAECHVSDSDPFKTVETAARGARYGVSGIPHMRIDGKFSVVGAGSCVSAANSYRTKIQQRITETGGVSPVDVTGYVAFDEFGGTLQADFTQIDPGTFTAHQGTLFLIEDDVTWCCGYGGEDHWDGVVRVARTQPVSLNGVGQVVTLIESFDIGSGWNTDNLRAVAIFEEVAGTKTVIQSGVLDFVVDFTIALPRRVGSVPEGSGTELFDATIQNVSDATDLLTISVNSGFGSWLTQFQLEGDPTWYTTTDVSLDPAEIQNLVLRVQTDAAVEIRTGGFLVESNATGRISQAQVRVFNGSHSILLVDDDGATSYQANFEAALPALGYLYEDWDVWFGHANASPGPSDMLGFDAIIWHTGYQASNVLTPTDVANLMTYLDGGGRLFLSSMDFLSGQGGGNDFTHLYLGIASWVNSSKANVANGVPGDPITDGMAITLTYPQSAWNRVDTVNPEPAANAIFFSETGNPNALRFEQARGFRTVFSSIPQAAMSTSDPDPNNSETAIDRTLTWLLESSTTGVENAAVEGWGRILEAEPNPFRAQTAVSFTLTARSAGPVSLSLLDASGREVRKLFQEVLPAGEYEREWNGRDNLGRLVPAGIYFARLESALGSSTGKVVYLK